MKKHISNSYNKIIGNRLGDFLRSLSNRNFSNEIYEFIKFRYLEMFEVGINIEAEEGEKETIAERFLKKKNKFGVGIVHDICDMIEENFAEDVLGNININEKSKNN
jgi:hypothetical protein